MRSTKSIILVVIALGCGLVASIGISQVMYDSSNLESVQTEPIYVAAVNVPSWKPITSQSVQLEEWPKDKIPPGAARKLEEFEGMRARVPLYPGEPIMASKLSDGNSGAFSERIPKGYQVFAVKVDPESSLSGLVLPGDKVDVLVFIKADSEARSGRKVTMDLVKQTGTRTILRNVSVFAVNDRIGRNVEEEETIVAKTVSLLVRPDESERLLLAKQLGTIHLALRKPGDDSEVTTSGATPSDLNDVKQGGDGTELAETQGPLKVSNDIFDMLEEMKAGPTKSADTSIATESSAAAPVTVIMSPTGIVGTFTHAKEGQLPQEMMRGIGVLNTKTNLDNSSSDNVEKGDRIDPIGDDDADPDSLGL